MKAEDCIIYSYGFATTSSTIPAFSGRGDLLIVYVFFGNAHDIYQSRVTIIFHFKKLNSRNLLLGHVIDPDIALP